MKFITIFSIFLVVQGAYARFNVFNPLQNIAQAVNTATLNVVNTVGNTGINLANGVQNFANNAVAAINQQPKPSVTVSGSTSGSTSGSASGSLSINPTGILSNIGNVIGNVVNNSMNVVNNVVNDAVKVINNVGNITTNLIVSGIDLSQSIGAEAANAINAGFNSTNNAIINVQNLINTGVNLTQATLQSATNTINTASSLLLNTLNGTLGNASNTDLSDILNRANQLLNTSTDISRMTGALFNKTIMSVDVNPIIKTAVNAMNVANFVLQQVESGVRATMITTLGITNTMFSNMFANSTDNCSSAYTSDIANLTTNLALAMTECSLSELKNLELSINTTNQYIETLNNAIQSGSYSLSLLDQVIKYGATMGQQALEIVYIQPRAQTCISVAAVNSAGESNVIGGKIAKCQMNL